MYGRFCCHFDYAGNPTADGLEKLIDGRKKHDLPIGCCNVSYELQQHGVIWWTAQHHVCTVQVVKAEGVLKAKWVLTCSPTVLLHLHPTVTSIACPSSLQACCTANQSAAELLQFAVCPPQPAAIPRAR